MVKGVPSATFKNQPEQDELDSTSRLDSTCPLFVRNYAVTDLFQSETNQLKTATSMLKNKKQVDSSYNLENFEVS